MKWVNPRWKTSMQKNSSGGNSSSFILQKNFSQFPVRTLLPLLTHLLFSFRLLYRNEFGEILVNNIFTPLWCVLMLCHPYYAISFLFMSVSIISAISKNLAGTNVPESTLQATCRYDYFFSVYVVSAVVGKWHIKKFFRKWYGCFTEFFRLMQGSMFS